MSQVAPETPPPICETCLGWEVIETVETVANGVGVFEERPCPTCQTPTAEGAAQ